MVGSFDIGEFYHVFILDFSIFLLTYAPLLSAFTGRLYKGAVQYNELQTDFVHRITVSYFKR